MPVPDGTAPMGTERTVADATEREIKLAAGPGFARPNLDGVAPGIEGGRTETIELDATYFDTADLRLARRGATLRHRRRGVRGTWTLKLPTAAGDAGVDVLERAELDLDGPPGDVPASFAALVAADVRTATLRPVARLQTRRRRTVVRGADGKPVAEVADDEVSVLDGGRVAVRFRELEVEMAEGVDRAVVDAVTARLVAAGAEVAEPIPKLVAALGPPARRAPEVAPADLADDPTVEEVITGALRSAATRIIEHHPVALLGRDPEGVHQMRVGTRRLRSDLRTFRPLLDRRRTDPLRDELRWLAEILGAVRDPDVLLDRLQGSIERSAGLTSGADHLLGRLVAQRERATVDLAEALTSDRYRALLDSVVRLATHPPLRDRDRRGEAELRDVVRPGWTTLRRTVERLPDEPADEELHAVRKQAKQVRYAFEAVAPAVGRDAARAAKRLAAVQEVLGRHQDTTVAEAWLRAAAVESPAPSAFVAGVLLGVEQAERVVLRASWLDAWERAATEEHWSWLA